MPTNVLVLNKSWVVTGAGAPEGLHAAPLGSLYLREEGAAGTSLYVKEGGPGSTGWCAVSGGTVRGPVTSGIPNLASYADATGQRLQDSGIPSPQVARLDTINGFTQPQTLLHNTPTLVFHDPSQAADQKRWVIGAATPADADFYIQTRSDINTPLMDALVVRRNGFVEMASALWVKSGGATIIGTLSTGLLAATEGVNASLGYVLAGSLTVTGGAALQSGLTVTGTVNATTVNATFGFAPNVWHLSTSDGMQRMHFTLSGPSYLKGAGVTLRNAADANIARFTDAGAFVAGGYIYPFSYAAGVTQESYFIAFHSGFPAPGAMYLNCNIACAGYLVPSGVVYPGSISTGGWQNSYYIASHSSYGLYTNTGMYFAGPVYTMSNLYLMAQTGTVSWYLGTWPSGLYTNVSIKTAGHLYPGNREDMYLSADSGGTYTNTTFECRAGHLRCGYWFYPGPLTNPGVIQTSWYLGSHSSYGLYSNTGLYIEGSLWTAAGLSVAGTGSITTANIVTCNVSSVMSAAYYRSMGYVGRAASTVYYAYQDGFVMCFGYWGAGGHIYVGSGGSGSGTEMRGEMGSDTGVPGYVSGTITIPVRYGEYWQAWVGGNAAIVRLYWFPIGSYTG
jgi:hypothetical protein